MYGIQSDAELAGQLCKRDSRCWIGERRLCGRHVGGVLQSGQGTLGEVDTHDHGYVAPVTRDPDRALFRSVERLGPPLPGDGCWHTTHG